MNPRQELQTQTAPSLLPAPEQSATAGQQAALQALQAALSDGSEWTEPLWNCIRLYQNYSFTTSGRGKTPGLPFTYTIKTGRGGAMTEEMVVDRKEKSKTITRSTVELAVKNAISVQKEEGIVRGPKKLKTFGSSYLYGIFTAWGIIRGAVRKDRTVRECPADETIQ